jgi:hypothetical protein
MGSVKNSYGLRLARYPQVLIPWFDSYTQVYPQKYVTDYLIR